MAKAMLIAAREPPPRLHDATSWAGAKDET